MTEQKQSCGECHWWREDPGGVFGLCRVPVPEYASGDNYRAETDGTHCPTFRQRGERLPQRFKVWLSGGWSFGICWPMKSGRWAINLLTMHDTFDSDPSESLKMLVGDAEVVWIDNDFGWSGT